MHDLVESRSRGGTPKVADGERGGAFSQPAEAAAPPEPQDIEHELEAYLQTIATDADGGDEAEAASNGSGGEVAVDLDDYLNELTIGEGEPAEDGSEDAVDLEQYMQELQEEERGK